MASSPGKQVGLLIVGLILLGVIVFVFIHFGPGGGGDAEGRNKSITNAAKQKSTTTSKYDTGNAWYSYLTIDPKVLDDVKTYIKTGEDPNNQVTDDDGTIKTDIFILDNSGQEEKCKLLSYKNTRIVTGNCTGDFICIPTKIDDDDELTGYEIVSKTDLITPIVSTTECSSSGGGDTGDTVDSLLGYTLQDKDNNYCSLDDKAIDCSYDNKNASIFTFNEKMTTMSGDGLKCYYDSKKGFITCSDNEKSTNFIFKKQSDGAWKFGEDDNYCLADKTTSGSAKYITCNDSSGDNFTIAPYDAVFNSNYYSIKRVNGKYLIPAGSASPKYMHADASNSDNYFFKFNDSKIEVYHRKNWWDSATPTTPNGYLGVGGGNDQQYLAYVTSSTAVKFKIIKTAGVKNEYLIKYGDDYCEKRKSSTSNLFYCDNTETKNAAKFIIEEYTPPVSKNIKPGDPLYPVLDGKYTYKTGLGYKTKCHAAKERGSKYQLGWDKGTLFCDSNKGANVQMMQLVFTKVKGDDKYKFAVPRNTYFNWTNGGRCMVDTTSVSHSSMTEYWYSKSIGCNHSDKQDTFQVIPSADMDKKDNWVIQDKNKYYYDVDPDSNDIIVISNTTKPSGFYFTKV